MKNKFYVRAYTLKKLRPNKFELSLLLIVLFIGLYFNHFYPQAESILGYAGFIFIMLLSHFIGWFIVFCFHLFLCAKHHVNFYGHPKVEE